MPRQHKSSFPTLSSPTYNLSTYLSWINPLLYPPFFSSRTNPHMDRPENPKAISIVHREPQGIEKRSRYHSMGISIAILWSLSLLDPLWFLREQVKEWGPRWSMGYHYILDSTVSPNKWVKEYPYSNGRCQT